MKNSRGHENEFVAWGNNDVMNDHRGYVYNLSYPTCLEI